MIVGVPREIKTEEHRVGMTPAGVRELCGHGHEVLVQENAGAGVGLTDSAYRQAGARIVADRDEIFSRAKLIVKVKEPQLEEAALLGSDQTLFTYLHLAAFPALTDALLESGVCAIAYETVTDPEGRLPLLAPMSEVAGRMSIQAAAHFLEKPHGGSGVLLAGVPGVAPGRVLILGGGVVGKNAAQIAVGLGAEVTILDRTAVRMRELEAFFGNRVRTLYSSREEIEQQLATADVVVGAVLIAGTSAPRLVTRDMLSLLRPGSVIVDVAIDQGGCFETSRPTTHSDPVFEVDNIIHYCVANMPGAVPRTSTFALTSATLPFIQALADRGCEARLREDVHLRHGLNVYKGQVTHNGVAEALGKTGIAAETALGMTRDTR
ncbi:MAG: alanine dehydrogenase [Gammaproteobacteria bacterium]|nr:alanine dehydrogenase [Pseudomonadales bacterium]MCP5345457.1 alanine dehydrogenase [Pseudomonadales bacterium]